MVLAAGEDAAEADGAEAGALETAPLETGAAEAGAVDAGAVDAGGLEAAAPVLDEELVQPASRARPASGRVSRTTREQFIWSPT
jgi:hypothetical protein